MTESKLKACRVCNKTCQVEHFNASDILIGGATLWLCGGSKLRGGSCASDAHFSAESWNAVNTPRTHTPRTHPPEYARLIEAAEAVEAEISRSVTRGNSPGHGHQIDGVWDDDSSNGRNAGKPCEWCAQWHEFAAALAATKETQP
jgi:hypothetical protein